MDIQKLYEAETAYTSNFSKREDTGVSLRFRDASIPDMYMHNMTVYPKRLDDETLRCEVQKELDIRRKEKADFLQLECYFTLEQAFLDTLPIPADYCVDDLMTISTEKFTTISGNPECIVVPANDPAMLEDGRRVDYLTSLHTGEDFATRRSVRRMRAYAEPNDLTLYVCYYKGEAVGKVELFLHKGLAKIEEFNILDQHQRKGFGTAAVRKLLEEARAKGIGTAYLVTSSDDTPREMYAKCGFTKAAEKSELHFKLK